jgi:hypothetical protein
MSKIIEDINSFLGETKEIMSTAVPTVNNLITGVGMLNSITGIISDTQESSVEEFNKLKAKYNQSSNEYIIQHLMQQNKLILNIALNPMKPDMSGYGAKALRCKVRQSHWLIMTIR